MGLPVTTKQLCAFLEAEENKSVDFALYAYRCGCSNFVKHASSYSVELDKSIHSYHFLELYTSEEFSKRLPYFVSYIQGRSYLFYENDDEVVIWACYTEEEFRGQGYMKHLLQDLKKRFPDKTINIDTFSETLLRYSKDNEFKVFPR